MTRERQKTAVGPPGAFARVLSFLLLGFIFYGTTVEAAHVHTTTVAPADFALGASLSDPDTTNDVIRKLAGCGDCLICQLHQHFSASLLSVRDIGSPQQTQTAVLDFTTTILRTRTDAPRSGRAPPPAN